jgi:hypothetical protein
MLSGDINAQQKDYLEDDWGADFEVSLNSSEQQPGSDQTSTLIDRFWEQAALKLKSDLAYQDELTMARGQARFDATARPFAQTFLKLDLQYTYYHQKDDLVLSPDSIQHALKINDAWFQYTQDACNAKAGRQKLFWGAVEGSYALDVLMPLDLTEPLLTDFSLIRRSQDMAVFTCFMQGYQVELFFTPQALLDQSTIRQAKTLQTLENKLDNEWGGRITKHFAGLDVGLYVARVYENTPETVIDFNTLSVAGYQLDQFDLYGFSVVYAIDRLLLEADFSYQKEIKRIALGEQNTSDTLKYRSEAALGFEYTTESNHQLSAGAWFFSYLSPLDTEQEIHAQMWNINWSKQYWNDDLTLSALGLWQKQPDVAQLTVMADYLWDDQWSSALALSYKAPSSAASHDVGYLTIQQGWSVNLGVEYQF